jgi:TFIIF-interacting CTD phosphatase-like protein
MPMWCGGVVWWCGVPTQINRCIHQPNRPHLREFLEEVSKLYELHIYTNGTKEYANVIAKVIDPRHLYFHERIVSRNEKDSMVTTIAITMSIDALWLHT